MGKQITVSVPHRLTAQEAKARIQSGIADAKRQFASQAKIEDNWTGDRMDFSVSVMGQALTGNLDVQGDRVNVALDRPWILAALSGQITAQIEQQGRKLLEKK